jgi:hypothetical protein
MLMADVWVIGSEVERTTANYPNYPPIQGLLSKNGLLTLDSCGLLISAFPHKLLVNAGVVFVGLGPTRNRVNS